MGLTVDEIFSEEFSFSYSLLDKDGVTHLLFQNDLVTDKRNLMDRRIDRHRFWSKDIKGREIIIDITGEIRLYAECFEVFNDGLINPKMIQEFLTNPKTKYLFA
jgi:hypothetical protein